MESVLTEAVGLLDEAGEPALTFRALAARLGGGVASIYWYVSGKDELLARSADHVLAQVLAASTETPDDPIEAVRELAMALFEAMVHRPWLGQFFMRDPGTQPNSLRLYERIGQQVLRLGMPPRETFHAASAVVGFVIGIGADVAQQGPPEHLASSTRGEVLQATTDEWRDLDDDEWPFLHAIADVFADHDDTEQFAAGLDLLLSGVRRQADRLRD